MTFLKDETWNGQVYSGGWISPQGGTAAVIEPATGHELGRTGIATPGRRRAAAATAAAAQRAWAATPHTERAAVLRRAGDAVARSTPTRSSGWIDPRDRRDRPARRSSRRTSPSEECYEAAGAPVPALRRAAAERAAAASLRRAGARSASSA